MQASTNTAVVALWTKGFTVTRNSPEFQLVIPSDKGELYDGLETALAASTQWTSLLHGLYHLSDRDLAYERCLLITEGQATVVVAGPMLDRHSRRAVAICSATQSVDWSSQSLADSIARANGLAVRLLHTYTTTLSQGDSNVERQLQKGQFLKERSFDLSSEQPVASSEWELMIDAIREMSGVTGVSTPRLLLLGANVALGTRHEAEVLQAQGADVDGFIDPRIGRVTPVTDNLSPWPWRSRQETRSVSPAAATDSDSEQVSEESERGEASRRQYERSVDRVHRASHELVDAWIGLLGTMFGHRRR